MYGYGYSPFINSASSSGSKPIDPDAQAFITAAAITNPTQQTAINQLVVDLKGYGVWSKMKALYPFVGSSASSHKYNLKNPLDTDAAFRLVFNGGWTHSANGALPNGINAWADTFLNPSVSLAQNSTHLSSYSRTNILNTGQIEIGVFPFPSGVGASCFGISSNGAPLGHFRSRVSTSTPSTSYIPTDSRGLFVASRIISSQQKAYRNGILQETANINSDGIANFKIPIAGLRIDMVTVTDYSAKQTAFASIGDGLTDTEAANFYTAVQTFQVTLGRSIGTQTVSDADAQAFVTNAGIVDQVEADAVNNLVIGLKADGLWSKMKAVYPFVGSSASSHKYNLKNPLDTDAAFRIVWNGGMTHSNTGVQFGGVNGFGNTFLNPLTTLSQNNISYSVYSRSNIDALRQSIGNIYAGATGESSMFLRTGNIVAFRVNVSNFSSQSNNDSRGLFIANRTSSTVQNLAIRGTISNHTNTSQPPFNASFRIGGADNAVIDNKELAFAHIGDGLTNTDMTNLNSHVITFQTTLNRQV